jgi:ABC-type transport system involved in cytochrome bd biosynthesis fused ATPase/permease subunit
MEKTIKGYLRGKTIVLITHSLSYLDNTDNVIIIDKGKITEETKKELQNTEENLIKKHLI